VSLARIERKAHCLPKGNTPRSGIGANHSVPSHARQQLSHQLSANTATAKGGLEAPHAQSVRHDRVNRETADSDERSIYANGEQSFPSRANRTVPASQSARSGSIWRPPGERFCPQHVKAGRQVFDYGFGFHPHPSHSYAKIYIIAM
jgi:hypothetical protein